MALLQLGHTPTPTAANGLRLTAVQVGRITLPMANGRQLTARLGAIPIPRLARRLAELMTAQLANGRAIVLPVVLLR